ncbi:MAG: hypothetical protein K6F48_10925 [Paludibacteraceae bacterium]|nr:hypothetical protein [Paludibacteraceae bacterium]
MGTKNLWVLCVSMCLGVFGVYSCGDDDELENERRNSPQEENVEKDTLQNQEGGALTTSVMDSLLVGKWIYYSSSDGYENNGEIIFHENGEGSYSQDSTSMGFGDSSNGFYCEWHCDLSFSWSSKGGDGVELRLEKSKIKVNRSERNNGVNTDSSEADSVNYVNGEMVKLTLDSVTSSGMFFRSCGDVFPSSIKTHSIRPCDGNTDVKVKLLKDLEVTEDD